MKGECALRDKPGCQFEGKCSRQGSALCTVCEQRPENRKVLSLADLIMRLCLAVIALGSLVLAILVGLGVVPV